MKQLVVISGKGGTGKTVISASFASLAENKVMADCDVDAADLHLLLKPEVKEKYEFRGGKIAIIDQEKCIQCGECIDLCRFNAITYQLINLSTYQQIVIDPISCEGCGMCVWICPEEAIELKKKTSGEWFVSHTKYGPMVHARLGIAEENSGKLVSIVRQKAKEIAEKEKFNFVIIDGPPGIGCPVIASLTNTDLALIVTEPTMSGIHDFKRVVDLAKHFGIKALVCINKCDINLENTFQIEKFCKDSQIEVIGKIPFSPAVTYALVRGLPVVEFSKGEVSQEIRKMWVRITNE